MTDDIRPELREAYNIFVGELRTHTEFLSKLVTKAKEAPDALEFLRANAPSLEQRFHLLKGGSGFLKLDDLRELSKRGEQLAKNLNKESLGELESIVFELQTHGS